MPSSASRVRRALLAGLLFSSPLRAADPAATPPQTIDLGNLPAKKPKDIIRETAASSVDTDDPQQLYIHGQYEKALAQATARTTEDPRTETWPLLRCAAELQLGKYDEARAD